MKPLFRFFLLAEGSFRHIINAFTVLDVRIEKICEIFSLTFFLKFSIINTLAKS